MKILVTGGCGYIGSHICLELLKNDYETVVLDNCVNSECNSLKTIERLTGKTIAFYSCSVNNYETLVKVFEKERFDGVIHLAMKKKYRSQSNSLNDEYYIENIQGILNLIRVMTEFEVFNLIFASSAAVYGITNTNTAICEDMPLSGNTDYATVKIMQEMILEDLIRADKRFSVSVLRYFNPIGADKSGLIGENSKLSAQNIIPHIMNVVLGNKAELTVFGGYSSTSDGSGIRDYVHISDVAMANINVIEHKFNRSGIYKYNIGSGEGHSVLELISEFEKLCGKKIPYKILPPPIKESEISCANIKKAADELGFKPRFDFLEMCKSELKRYF